MLLLCGLSAGGGSAQAQAVPEPYVLRWGVDLPVMIASGTVGSAWLFRDELDAARCAPLCDRDRLASFDRVAAGRYDPNMRLLSDLGVAGLLVGGAAALWFDGGAVDLAIGAESVLVTSGVAVTLMMTVRRPRPFLYGEEAPLDARRTGGAAVSFPSGHTANAFALAVALFQIERARHPGSSLPYWILGGTLAAGTGIAMTRVLAGDHFPSDVVAGALLGSAIGWAIPELHRLVPNLSLAPQAGGLSVTGGF